MPKTFTLFLLFFGLTSYSQVNFEVSDVIHESYLPSTPPGEYPILIESDSGSLHLIKAGYVKKVVITDLSKSLSVIDIRKIKMPKGSKVQELFQYKGRPYFIFQLKSGIYQITKLDIKTGEFESILEYNLPDYFDKKKMTQVDLVYSENDGIGFHFSRHQMSQILDSLPTSHIVMFNKNLTTVLWESTIKKPQLIRIDKGPRKERRREGTMIRSINFQDINTMIVHSDIGKVLVSNGNPPTRYFLYQGNITSMYRIENGKSEEIWEKKINGNYTKRDFQERAFNIDSINETDPIPFLNELGEVESFSLELGTKGEEVKLIHRNANNDILESLVVLSDLSDFLKKSSSEIYGRIIPDSSLSNTLLFEFQMEPFTASNPQSTILSFRKKENKIDKINYQEGVYWKQYGTKLLEAEELNFYENKMKYGAELSKKLDRYVDLKISHTDSYKAHFIINGQVYTMFTAYLIGNMTTQIVRWSFD